MTDERYEALMDYKAELNEEEIKEGYHFCSDWDGLLIAPHMGEWLSCNCFEEKLKATLAYTGQDMGQEVIFPPF